MLEIRSVNGWGARCGCGGMSRLHRCTSRPVSPETSLFLCADCVNTALDAFMATRPDQPPYWPGDEDRDEPYAAPSYEAGKTRCVCTETWKAAGHHPRCPTAASAELPPRCDVPRSPRSTARCEMPPGHTGCHTGRTRGGHWKSWTVPVTGKGQA